MIFTYIHCVMFSLFKCPGDPTCSSFGMIAQGVPSPKMEASLLYRLHSNGIVPGVDVDKNRFKEVYKSKYGKVRIYKILSVSKESKEWVKNNLVCDAPGSWFCKGQYPPGLQKVCIFLAICLIQCFKFSAK